MDSAQLKHELLSQLAGVARGLGHEHRLELLELVAQAERSVDELAEASGLSVANTSQHLQQMRRAGLLAVRREGRRALYRLADDGILELVQALWRVGTHRVSSLEGLLAGYTGEAEAPEAVSRSQLLERMRDSSVTLLDLRSPQEFRQGRLPGALNISLDELEQQLANLPEGQEIIAYCRGPYCMLSHEAARMLRQRGYSVRRLQDGFPEWRAAGLPVEVGV